MKVERIVSIRNFQYFVQQLQSCAVRIARSIDSSFHGCWVSKIARRYQGFLYITLIEVQTKFSVSPNYTEKNKRPLKLRRRKRASVLSVDQYVVGVFQLVFLTSLTDVARDFFHTTCHSFFSSQPSFNVKTKFRDREGMKTVVSDPWANSENSCPRLDSEGNHFEDCFVDNRNEQSKLPDSEQYLQSLYSKLRAVQGGSSKKDLVKSLTAVKEDCIARILTEGCQAQNEEESELAANPLVRHIAPHLQALTASELVQLLKADVLQAVTDQQHDQTTSE